MRAEVLAGRARPDALGALVFHGLWHGLRVLQSIAVSPLQAIATESPPTAIPANPLDRQLVRLLADMVLATQLEVQHAP